MTRSLSRASSIGAAVLLLQGSVPVDSSQI